VALGRELARAARSRGKVDATPKLRSAPGGGRRNVTRRAVEVDKLPATALSTCSMRGTSPDMQRKPTHRSLLSGLAAPCRIMSAATPTASSVALKLGGYDRLAHNQCRQWRHFLVAGRRPNRRSRCRSSLSREISRHSQRSPDLAECASSPVYGRSWGVLPRSRARRRRPRSEGYV
jgi:hypothetical protein